MYCYVEPIHTVTLGKIVELLYSFKASRDNRSIPNTEEQFTKKTMPIT